ncbi:MAG: primosomal protein N' [Phycisphaerales bacterium]
MTDPSLFPTPDDTPGPPDRLALVAPEQGIDAPEGLTYEAPIGLGQLTSGDRVEIPLGRADTTTTGYILEILHPAGTRFHTLLKGVKRLKAVSRRLSDDAPSARIPPTLLELARWMDAYCCCPIGMVLASMLPRAVKEATGSRTETVLERTGVEPVGTLSPTIREAWDKLRALSDDTPPMPAKQLRDRLGLRSVAPLNRLKEKGVLREAERSVVRTRRAAIDALLAPDGPTPTQPDPTPAQTSAIDGISATLGDFAPHLLFGVTGSGKTEVYLRVIERALLRGEGAIVLVPEIMLTPQTTRRFIQRFGRERVALLHSGLTDAQRHDQWSRIATGEAAVAIGPRSALFAPFSNDDDLPARPLGVIVVDEEHDASYKQDQLPRYHARNIAIKRAQLERCPVVLGSATPSLESWRNAVAGRFRLHRLPDRVPGARLPDVTIVDLLDERRHLKELGGHRSLGPVLAHALAQTLQTPDLQALLLLNRRGLARCLCCSDTSCAWTLRCQHCDASMVVHERAPGRRLLRCHHCHAENAVPKRCPECAHQLITLGAGTQRLEQEIARLFPDLPEGQVLRLDADTMRRHDDYTNALHRFATGEARLMLGTQMIAKGLDFPNVALIGVVSADTALELPDFRASERTFQLVAQVAGRAGRGSRPARVIVQTMHPTEPAIQLAAQHDYETFATSELAIREDLQLPPCARMARLVFHDTDHAKAKKAATAAHSALVEAMNAGTVRIRLDPPTPQDLPRRADHFRIAIDVFAPTPGDLTGALTLLREKKLVKADARTIVDVDPVALM